MWSALILVTWANGAPLIAGLLLGHRWERPLDAGRVLWDGRRMLGRSKTWRGWLASLATTPVVATLLGLPWWLGLSAAAGAMLGDTGVSFAKRRLGLGSSESAPLLDQIPESLLPALLLAGPLALAWDDVLLIIAGFTLVDIAATPVFGLMRRRWRL